MSLFFIFHIISWLTIQTYVRILVASMAQTSCILFFFLTFSIARSSYCLKHDEQIKKVLKDLEDLLQQNVDDTTGLFDQVGSIDVGVWRKTKGNITNLYSKSFGKSQVKNVSVEVAKIKNNFGPFDKLKEIAQSYLPSKPNTLNVSDKNPYRIASNTKAFIGVAAEILVACCGLNLDTKIHPKYVNLSTLGRYHKWDNPSMEVGYTSVNFTNSNVYIENITFRHLLTHTSGLSREAMNLKYAYASSRTDTARCPPNDKYQGTIPCDERRDTNWRAWTQHVISYMMPNCNYTKYNEMSSQTSCLPGEYFHYSNAGYAILGLALDQYGKQESDTIELFIKQNILDKFEMNNTEFTWIDYDEQLKGKTAHGCQGGRDFLRCNQSRALTDYSDRGIKTMPGGMWSTTRDLAMFLLNLDQFPNVTNLDSNINARVDEQSEEDISQMPYPIFRYGHGWYIATNFSCVQDSLTEQIQGAWGTVPGFTSYMITNPKVSKDETQYAVAILRNYNYAIRFNLGNQARRLLWRLIHPNVPLESMTCPVIVKDNFATGDQEIHSRKYDTTANPILTTPILQTTTLSGSGLLLYPSTFLLAMLCLKAYVFRY